MVEGDLDEAGVTGGGLVDRVVDQLPDRWCRPSAPVPPMYMPGRLRTASRPSSSWMRLGVVGVGGPIGGGFRGRHGVTSQS